MEKSARVAAGPKNPPDGATHGPRALPEWGNRGTGLPAVSPCPQNWEMEGGTCAARGCHRARAAGGCRGWRGTRRSGDVIEPGTSPSSRPICRGAAAILGSGNLGLSAQAGRGSGQGHRWLVVASRTEPHARVPNPGWQPQPQTHPRTTGSRDGSWDEAWGRGDPVAWDAPTLLQQRPRVPVPHGRVTAAGTGTRVAAQPGSTLARSSQPAN